MNKTVAMSFKLMIPMSNFISKNILKKLNFRLQCLRVFCRCCCF